MWVHVRSLIMAVDMAVGMVMVMAMDIMVTNTNVNQITNKFDF